MRVVSGPKLTLLNSQRLNFYATAKVEDGDGTMRDCTSIVGIDFFDGATWTENIDQPVATGTITLRREGITSGGTHVSLSPTMTASPANRKVDTTYSPLLVAGRRVQILFAWTVANVAPVSGDWMLMFDGKIDTVNWKGLDSVVTLDVRDRGGWLQDTFIEAVREYGTTTGVPVESVMQQILTDNPNAKLGAVTLYTPVSPGWNIRKFKQDQKSVLDALRDLAQQIGWDVRYVWREATAQFELTLYQPDRAKSAPDWTLGPDQYFEVSDLKQTDANVRNRIRVRTQTAAGVAITSLAVDAASVTKFGPRYMEVSEDATSNIDTQAEADAMSAAMLSDLRDPIADQEIENMLYPIAQLGDLGTWSANGKQYDADQQFAVIQVKHDVTREKRRTFIQSRGRVAGAFNAWLALEDLLNAGITPDDRALALKNFREVRATPTVKTFGWDPVGADVAEIWAWGKLSPQDADPPLGAGADEDRLWRDTKTETPDRVLDNTTTEFDVTVPDFGFIQTWEFLPVDASGTRGFSQRVRVLSVPDIPRITSIETVEGASGLFTDITKLNVVDPQSLGGTLKVWLNHDVVDDADPTAAPDGTITVALTPRTFVTADVFTVPGGTNLLFDNVRIHPGAGKRVAFEFVNSRGISSGVIGFVLLSNGGIIDANGVLLNDSINLASQVAASMTLPSVYATLPGTGRTNELAFLTSDSKLYRWTGSAWTAAVPAVDLTGQITGTQITNGAVSTPKLAANSVTTSILAANAVTANEIASNAITAGKILAAAVTTTALNAGAVTAVKMSVAVLSDITTGAGVIVSGKLQNAAGTSYLDLSATGSNPFLTHPGIVLRADGTATFSGVVAAGTFTSTALSLTGADAIISFAGMSAFATTTGIIFSRGGSQATMYGFVSSTVVGLSFTADGNIVFNTGATKGVIRVIGSGATKPIPVVAVFAGAPTNASDYKAGDLACDTSNLRMYVIVSGAWVQTTA